MFIQLAIKILAWLNLCLGRIFCKRLPSYPPESIKKILIKRTDRLGDAALSLPIILELSKRYQVTVLTSSYNDILLKEFSQTKIFSDQPSDFLGSVKDIFFHLFFTPRITSSLPAEYDLLLDLNGIKELDVFFKIRRQNLCRYYAGFSLGIWNLFLDYAYPQYPALFSSQPLLMQYCDFLKHALDIDVDLEDYIDFSKKMTKPQDFQVKGDFILINIGGQRNLRGPTTREFARVVNCLDFDGEWVVMDEQGGPNLQEFVQLVKNKNITYLKGGKSIWELLYIASLSKLYIGSDSGITNLLQFVTHAVIFFANGNPRVWRPFSKNPYQTKIKKGLIVEETTTSKNFRKKIIYVSAWCRPCFDLGCAAKFCVFRLEKFFDLILQEIQECINQ